MKAVGPASLSTLLESTVMFFRVMVWLIALAFVVTVVIQPEGAAFNYRVPISSGPRLDEPPLDDLREEGVALEAAAVELRVGLDAGGRWGLLVGALHMVLIALFLGQLRGVLRTLQGGSPFVADNAIRIRNLGLLVFGYELLRILTVVFYADPFIERSHANVATSITPDFAYVFFGCLLLVLAAVFKQGTDMQAELEHTV